MKNGNEETLPRNPTKRLSQPAIGKAIPCSFQESWRHFASDYPASEATYTHTPLIVARATDSRTVHIAHGLKLSGAAPVASSCD
jgi:hypothetical protein